MTMNEPKVSLIIPAYNEEKYIGTCVEYAIKNSGGKFFEIIVVDNNSFDRTKEIAEKIKGVRVVCEKKKGVMWARQRGFTETRGDILAYIDADTRMPHGWYEMLVSEFKKNEQLSCVSGPCMYYDIPGRQQMLVKIYWYFLALPVYLIIGYMTVGGNFAIRRSVLEKMSGFDTSIPFYGDDTNIARRAHSFGKVKFKLRFVIYTSGRRLVAQGLFKTSFLYAVNFLSEAMFHRQVTKEYKDIR